MIPDLPDEPSALLAWVREQRTAGGAGPEPNFRGLAQSAQSRAYAARREDRAEEALQWAEVALAVYDWAMSRSGDRDKWDYGLSAMYLRSSMIAKYGPSRDHPILDLDTVVEWTREQVDRVRGLGLWNPDMDSIDLKAYFDSGRIGDVLELRRLKNSLGPLMHLVAEGWATPDADLSDWIASRVRLP